MATLTTAQFGSSSCPQAQLIVTQTASTDTTATLTWTLKWVTHGYTVSSSASKAYTVKINGVTKASSSFAIGGKTTQTITSGTVTINKITSEQSIALYLSFDMSFTWSGTSGGTKTASGSISVPKKTSYTISYSANGGSGAPSAQTKWYGTNITLSSTKPTRTGYNFSKWNTNSSGTGTSYNSGATYSANASATLYAIWAKKTYTVSYNANGGSGAPSAQTKTYGTTLTLSSTKPTRTNYTFEGWSTSSTGSVVYKSGASYTANAAVTLYAVWKKAYVKPTISKLTVNRCNSDGTISDTGTYIKVSVTYSCCQTAGTNPIAAVNIQWQAITNGSTPSTATVSSFSSDILYGGTLTQIVGDGAVDVEKTYDVTVTIVDSKSGSVSLKKSVPTQKFVIDFKSGGTGVAIGKVAETDNLFDVGIPSRFRSTMYMNHNAQLYSYDSNGTAKPVFQGQTTNNNTAIGYGNYSNKSGETIIYGYDVKIFASNIATPGGYKPYYSRSDGAVAINIRTSGYVVNGGKDVYFVVPLTKPILGSPTITASSNGDFKLTQGGIYTHGSSDSANASPSSYTATSGRYGVQIKATFSNTTNAVNRAPVGIHWVGYITFS